MFMLGINCDYNSFILNAETQNTLRCFGLTKQYRHDFGRWQSYKIVTCYKQAVKSITFMIKIVKCIFYFYVILLLPQI